MTRLAWGLHAHPGESPGYWGARALLQTSGDFPIDLLPDRQDSGGPLFNVLAKLLNKGGGIAIAQARVRALCNNWLMRPSKRHEFTIIDTDMMKMVANTNGSHGYLYLSAWLKPETFDVSEAKWEETVALPAAGDLINTSVWSEPIEVLTQINLHGNLFLVFLTGRKVRDLDHLARFRPLADQGDGGVSAVERLHYPHLAVGLTIGRELSCYQGAQLPNNVPNPTSKD